MVKKEKVKQIMTAEEIEAYLEDRGYRDVTEAELKQMEKDLSYRQVVENLNKFWSGTLD